MNNYGTLVGTAGSGTINFASPLFNSGTVEVDSGTLDFDSPVSTPISQLSGTTLTGGTWNVMNGASLVFPSGSNITNNQANITLSGAGASFGALANLATNSGSFALASGATFTTVGPLANDGTIALGPASVLSVTGAYSQDASAALGVVLGGRPASGQFGQLKSSGPAALDGTLDLSLADGFGPTAGDAYAILTASSVTGTFASIDRLTSGAGQFLNVAVNSANVTVTVTASASDLAVGAITVPAMSETPGQPVSIPFQVNNISTTATPSHVTTWTDSVYLSLSSTFDDTAVLVGRVTHQGVVAGGSSYSETLTAPVPGVAPGAYHVFVVADSRDLLPDPNRANNIGVGSSLLTVGYPALTLGTKVTGMIASGQDIYYKVTLPAGSATRIMAGSSTAGGVALYESYLSVPTSSTFDQSSADTTSLSQSILLPGTQAGTYYILVQGGTVLMSGQPFTLEAQSLPLEVLSVGTAAGANVGTTTLTVSGAMFTAGTTLKLVPDAGGTPIAASSVTEEDSSTLFASFNLTGAPAGIYNLEAVEGSQTATDDAAFTVTTGSPGQLAATMTVPDGIRPGRTGTVIINYSNTGGTDIPAPLFVLNSENVSNGEADAVLASGQAVDVLGINSTGPAGVLPPGAQGTIEVPFTPTSNIGGTVINFNLGEVPEDSTPIDWSSQEASLRPSNIPASAWGAVFANFVASVGSTTGQYVAALDADATYLSQLGESTDDVSRLIGFEILKADAFYSARTLATVTDASYPTPGAIPLDFVRQFNQSIGGRDQSGPLGDGWTDNWQISAATDAEGNVTITDDGATTYFTLQPDGSYMGMPDDHDTLTLVGGTYELREPDGDLTVFNPSGSLDYEEDPNGNRVTATYNSSGELTLLTASNGAALTITYNALGKISQVIDPAGQTSTFTYDASGEHLIAGTDMYGTTNYTYLTGPTAADANALSTIAYADNTHIYYTYDAQGQLTDQSRDGGAEALKYSYGAVGGYTVTDADKNASTILQDDMGLTVQTTNPLGNITRYSYDSESNLTSIVAADGTTTTFTYDSNGNETSETDPLGNVTRYTYDPTFSQMLTSTNPSGYTTTYGVDSNGNVTSITAPDGSVQQFTFNALGEAVQYTDADGQSTFYTYNNNGQITNETFADGTSDSYTYDNRGNMLTATGPGGDFSAVYNSLNLPTQVTEPDGTIAYSYNIVGQTTKMVETSGSSSFTVNYKYDALGRTEQLTDGNGNNIDTYTYDPAGNVIAEAKGNGTSTKYTFNADEDLTSVTNLAPGGKIVNSSFTYTYDALGRVTSMTTGGATTSYGYDADGELTSVNAPSQSIQYAYDPSGNRTSVTDNGVLTPYTVNSVNEYTAVGGTTYGYDADGNMTSSTTGGVTTTYTFNAQNELSAVSSPGESIGYTYDPFGNQVSSSVNGTVTSNLLSRSGAILEQQNGSGSVLANYTYGIGLVSQVAPDGTAAYYDYDEQGSTVGITNAAGTYVNQYSYLPFGQTTTTSAALANPFTYAGRFGVTSEASGLLDMGAREYDPATGQFISNDPTGLAGGDDNLRRYVWNNPVDLADPTGLGGSAASSPLQGAANALSQAAGDLQQIPGKIPAAIQSLKCWLNGVGKGLAYAGNQLGSAIGSAVGSALQAASSLAISSAVRAAIRQQPSSSWRRRQRQRVQRLSDRTMRDTSGDSQNANGSSCQWRDEDRRFSGPQRHHRPGRLRQRWIHHAKPDAPLHDRFRESRDGHRPRADRRRHPAAQPEPRLEHLPARCHRLRQHGRERPCGRELLQHPDRRPVHARPLRRRHRRHQPEHWPPHLDLHFDRSDDARPDVKPAGRLPAAGQDATRGRRVRLLHRRAQGQPFHRHGHQRPGHGRLRSERPDQNAVAHEHHRRGLTHEHGQPAPGHDLASDVHGELVGQRRPWRLGHCQLQRLRLRRRWPIRAVPDRHHRNLGPLHRCPRAYIRVFQRRREQRWRDAAGALGRPGDDAGRHSSAASAASAGHHDEGPGRHEQEAPGDRDHRDLQRRRERHRSTRADDVPPGDPR